MNKNLKIVVYTGSFNPITKGHVMTMNAAIDAIKADQGMFVMVPGKYLNYKMRIKNKSSFILSEETREQMINSLCLDNNKFVFGGKELGSTNPSTIDTLRSIRRKNKDAEIYLLMGLDKLRKFPRWDGAEELINNFGVIVAVRNNYDIEELFNNDEFLAKYRDKFIIIQPDPKALYISSTIVRERFYDNQDYHDLMDDGPYNILKQFTPADFKEPTDEDEIYFQLTCGGRFGSQKACQLVFEANQKRFLDWDSSLLGSKEDKLNNTKVYKNQFTTNYNFGYNTIFDCLNEDCADVAQDMINDGYNPAILNLASNVSPGGGYHHGTSAQEECLCQMSTLSQSLYQFGSLKYKHIRDANLPNIPGVYPLDINYGGIYSPDVVFFRHNKSKHFTLRNNPFSSAVITVASLSNREKNKYTNDERFYFDEAGYLTPDGIEIEKNKIRTILRIALDNHHDSLVLGAFGCGAYNLKPIQVAGLFNEVLNEVEFKNNFKKITFSILERKGKNGMPTGSLGKFKPFYDLFNK